MQQRADASDASQVLRTHRSGARFLRVAAHYEPEVLRLGLLEAGGLERVLASAAGPRGRAPTAIVALDGLSERLHLRPVRHGGLLAPLWGERLLGLGRPLRELRVNARLWARGVPVPRPVLVAGRRCGGPFWSAAYATLHQDDALDAIAFLRSAPERRALLRACSAAGSAVRCLHDAGGRHRDLHAGNLLLRPGGSDPQCLVVDLDRARLVPRVDASARMAEIMRLHRSLVKRGLWDAVGEAGCEAFLESYTEGDRRLRERLLAFLPRERRRLTRHRLGHRLGLAQGREAAGERGPEPEREP